MADPGSPTHSRRKLDENFQPKSVEQPNNFSKQIPPLHPMTTCLPISLSRILRIACCLMGAMAAILMAPRVVAQQPAFLKDGRITRDLFYNVSNGFKVII